MFNDFYRGKTILVTGHTGFKGAWLSQWLLQLGAKVVGISSYIPSDPSLFDVLSLDKKIVNHRCDITNHQALLTICQKENPDMVFHLAAQPIVKVSYEDPKLTFDTNLGGTVNMLEVIKAVDSIKSAVMITSDKCYENVEWEYGYRENDRLGGKDPYSASKVCAEIAIHAYHESFVKCSGKRIASVRAGNVIGGGDWAEHRIVPDCMRAWSLREKVILRAPNATRPWQHVLEPLSGYLWLGALLSSPKSSYLNGESFNFGPDANVNASVETLIKSLAAHWDSASYESADHSLAMPEAGLLKLCCDKALHRLAWEPTLTFNQTIEMTSQWYRSFYLGTDMEDYTQQQLNQYMQLAQQKGQEWISNKTAMSAALS